MWRRRSPSTRHGPTTRNNGNVGRGYALAVHKAQGITTDRKFTVITGNTDREWAYVALSRGRHTNTIYLASPDPGREECTHLTHQIQWAGPDAAPAVFARSGVQIAAIDQELAHEIGPSIGR